MFIVDLGVEYTMYCKILSKMLNDFHNKELWKVKNPACKWCEYSPERSLQWKTVTEYHTGYPKRM